MPTPVEEIPYYADPTVVTWDDLTADQIKRIQSYEKWKARWLRRIQSLRNELSDVNAEIDLYGADLEAATGGLITHPSVEALDAQMTGFIDIFEQMIMRRVYDPPFIAAEENNWRQQIIDGTPSKDNPYQ